jgi:perosamine synthetase
MKHILHNKPTVGKNELAALKKTIDSSWIIAGPEVKEFENKMAKMHKRKFAVALNSGTSSIHLSLLALSIGKGDKVIVPSYTVGDLLNAILYTGAEPVVVDVEKNSFNMDPKKVAEKLSKKTKAIIVPHMLGIPAKIDEIMKFGIPIINDCAQSLGCIYNNKPLGSFGDFAIFSFYATKLITTAQGGMILTDNKKHYDFIKDIIDYNGRDNYKKRFNYPLTDMAAAMGNAQLNKLNDLLKRRKEIGEKYQEVLKRKNTDYWPKSSDTSANYYRFVLQFGTKKERENAKKYFEKKGISTIIPINNYELLHNYLGLSKNNFPNSEEMADTTLSLPIYPSLTDSETEMITDAISSL